MGHECDYQLDLDGQVTCATCGAMDDDMVIESNYHFNQTMKDVNLNKNNYVIVNVNTEHLEAILIIQELAHSSKFYELAEAFISKINYSPKTSYGILHNNKLVAYGIAFPCSDKEDVQLNSNLIYKLGNYDTLYIHDIAILPDFQGKGLSVMLIEKLKSDAVALGLEKLTLIAVLGSDTHWSKLGFTESGICDISYGPQAKKMHLKIT